MTDDSRYQRGRKYRDHLLGPDMKDKVRYFEELAPDLERMVMENLFGDIYMRPGLDPRTRSLCTISILARDGREVQLRAHINGALNIGAKKEEIVECLMQLLFYAGLPAASTGLRIAHEVFRERGLIPN
ncbi:MAG: carboxymuconolactone decarboxylase family protein [Pseudorhodoplanes sp.]